MDEEDPDRGDVPLPRGVDEEGSLAEPSIAVFGLEEGSLEPLLVRQVLQVQDGLAQKVLALQYYE